MAAAETDLLAELDERGFAVVRSLLTPAELARVTGSADELISARVAEKDAEDHRRRVGGETGPIDVWHPGERGWVAENVADHLDFAWLLRDRRLLDIATGARGPDATLTIVRVLAAMPGYGHQGFHPDRESADDPSPEAIGSWAAVGFFIMLSPHRPESGTIRVLPGSHRAPPDFETLGSAMPPHPDEVRLDADPGDVLVYSALLWKSGTFNGGHEPMKGVWIG